MEHILDQDGPLLIGMVSFSFVLFFNAINTFLVLDLITIISYHFKKDYVKKHNRNGNVNVGLPTFMKSMRGIIRY